MRARNFLAIPAFLFVCFTLAAADSAPKSAHADILNAQGTKIGTARITSTSGGGVKIAVRVEQLPPGSHGIHLHAVGKCDAPDFKTAGGHFNPTNAHHGVNNTENPHPHAGDLPNLTVGANGKGSASLVAKDVTLGDGANSLFHEGGTSLVIHAKADDMMSDPSGNSGDRIACGVIEK
jgi:Cu-Zn family superoxide dismutase